MTKPERTSSGLLRRPVFADPIVQWQADLVYPVCWATLLTVVLATVASVVYIGGPTLASWSTITLALPILLAIQLTRKGRVRAGAWVLSLSAFALITVAAIWFAKVTDVIHLLAIATFVAGLVLGGEALGILAALGVVLVVSLVLAERWGWLPEPSHDHGGVSNTIIALVVGVLMAAWIVSRAVASARRAREAWSSTNAELESVLGTLEQKVEQRTADLQRVNARLHDEMGVRSLLQADLIDERDEAQAAAEAKARFVANVTHELRTPLNGIVGVADLLSHERLPPAARRHVETIRTSGELMMGLVEDVLDFSRLEAERLELETIDFTLAKIVDAALAPFHVTARQRGLALEVEIDPQVPLRVRGDPGRLSQVLTNLVGNAVKFTPEGSITVKVAPLASIDDRTSRVRFRVEDTGVGMTPEVTRRVFEPFVQGDSSTTRRYGGTGLGLTISKQLVEHMGGEIRVSSEEGRGSTFEFDLPFAKPITERSLTMPRWTPELSGHSLNVLVVEDNAINQTVSGAMLDRLGHRHRLAPDGEVALEHLARTAYDVVLMDCQMPGKDGLQVCRELRAREGPNRTVPVVAMTAHDSPAQREATAAAGMDAFLSKPVRFEALAEVLAAIEAAPGSSEPERAPSPSVAAEVEPEPSVSSESRPSPESSPSLEADMSPEPPSSSPPSSPARAAAQLDERALQDLRMLEAVKPGLLAKMARLYLDQAPDRIAAVVNAETDEARAAAAHKLKGSSLSLGASEVGEAAAAIEKAARAGEATAELVSALRRAFEAITPAIEALAGEAES